SPMTGSRPRSLASWASAWARFASSPPVRMRSTGSATSVMRSLVVSSSTRRPSAWKASLSRTAVSRSWVVIRTVSVILRFVTLGVLAPEKLDRVAEQRVEHGHSIADAAGAAGQVDDQGTTTDPGHAAREPGEGRVLRAPAPDRLG